MKTRIPFRPAVLLLLALGLTGCATQTIEKRKQQRYAAYSALSPEHKAAVEAGQIKVGMSMDAVYVAWGKPSQVVQAETPQGSQIVWLYHDTYLHSYTYWSYGPYGYPYRARYYHYYGPGPFLRYDYYPVGYMKAEVVFENGVVKQWRTLPRPPY